MSLTAIHSSVHPLARLADSLPLRQLYTRTWLHSNARAASYPFLKNLTWPSLVAFMISPSWRVVYAFSLFILRAWSFWLLALRVVQTRF